MEWIFRYALGKRRKKAFIKRLISAFHKSFSVFGFWPLTFDLWLFFSFFLFFFLYPVSCILFPPALNVPADFIVSTNICFYGGLVAVTSTSAFISSTRSRNRHYVVTVSYTHLDVYKRQCLRWCPAVRSVSPDPDWPQPPGAPSYCRKDPSSPRC